MTTCTRTPIARWMSSQKRNLTRREEEQMNRERTSAILISYSLSTSRSLPQKLLSQHLLLGSQCLKSQSRSVHKRERGAQRDGGRRRLPREEVVPAAQRRENGRNERGFTQSPANRNHQPRYVHYYIIADGMYSNIVSTIKMIRSVLISTRQLHFQIFR